MATYMTIDLQAAVTTSSIYIYLMILQLQVALGFIRVANEAMCRPIRELTQSRGFDASHHKLACFGGAGIPPLPKPVWVH